MSTQACLGGTSGAAPAFDSSLTAMGSLDFAAIQKFDAEASASVTPQSAASTTGDDFPNLQTTLNTVRMSRSCVVS